MNDHNPFWDYFDCADEIEESLLAGADQAVETTGSDPLTLADLAPDFVARAREFCDATPELSWPPVLWQAEEYALNHKEVNA